MKKIKLGLLPKIIVAIILGISLGIVSPDMPVRVFVTFNALFSEFLGFLIPLIIVGLVTPAIADIGKGAGKLLLVTALLAYGATIFSGFLSYGVGQTFFPSLISDNLKIAQISQAEGIKPYFTVAIPAPLNVMTSLVMAFTLGLGIAHLDGKALKNVFGEFRDIITKTIQVVVLPLLPIYIFGIFFNMTHSGEVFKVLSVFVKIIGVIFVMHIFLLVLQYVVASFFVHKNPFRMLANMMPAYFTARHAVVGCYYSRYAAPDHHQRCGQGHCRICHSAVCYDSSFGQYDEDCGLLACAYDDARYSLRLPDDGGIHIDARCDDGCSAGCARWSHHGCTRHTLVNARFRPAVARADDSALHCDGQLWHSVQRDRRRCAGAYSRQVFR